MTVPLSLDRHATFEGVSGPVLVVVMDGVGVGRRDGGDAVHLARTPTLDALEAGASTTTLAAHGKAVGLPSDADMGNSEVGHNALGAGRVFEQGAKLVHAALESGSLFEGAVFRESVARVKDTGEPLHFMGLLSDGNVHSHLDHVLTMIRRCDQEGVVAVRVHALLDGRDVPETSALEYVEKLEACLADINHREGRDYRVASGGGRMTTTMDRYEADWSMVERGWNVHVRGVGQGFPSLREAVEGLREADPGVIDQNLPSFVIVGDDGAPVGPIRDGSAVVFFNFRGDRALEITRAFEEESFNAFDRGPRPDVLYAGMMQYDGDLELPSRFLVDPPEIERPMSQYLSDAGVTQLAISETQKFGHVTYFWNGNRSEPLEGERQLKIDSDLRPFEERPWMKAAEITDRLIDELDSGQYRHARVNYANGDMVGHTGVLESSILAVECVDLQLARLVECIERLSGAMIVTADHGNADQMFELDKATHAPLLRQDGTPRARTSHSLNRVPCHVFAPGRDLMIDPAVDAPGLANVAATVLFLLGFEAPADYLPSLVKESSR
ncbi:MAG: 2,3-bisphosphoglycerate-independent phosphoglycerate mutase [Sandaracinaceae bacterium]